MEIWVVVETSYSYECLVRKAFAKKTDADAYCRNHGFDAELEVQAAWFEQ